MHVLPRDSYHIATVLFPRGRNKTQWSIEVHIFLLCLSLEPGGVITCETKLKWLPKVGWCKVLYLPERTSLTESASHYGAGFTAGLADLSWEQLQMLAQESVCLLWSCPSADIFQGHLFANYRLIFPYRLHLPIIFIIYQLS